MCFDGGIGRSGQKQLMDKWKWSEEEVFENCYDSSKQVENGGPEWSCDPKCLTDDDFIDEVMNTFSHIVTNISR